MHFYLMNTIGDITADTNTLTVEICDIQQIISPRTSDIIWPTRGHIDNFERNIFNPYISESLQFGNSSTLFNLYLKLNNSVKEFLVAQPGSIIEEGYQIQILTIWTHWIDELFHHHRLYYNFFKKHTVIARGCITDFTFITKIHALQLERILKHLLHFGQVVVESSDKQHISELTRNWIPIPTANKDILFLVHLFFEEHTSV